MRGGRMKRLAIVLTAVLAVMATACDSDTVESKYSKYRASFSLSPINTIAPLNSALTSYGTFCTITADANHYYFRSLENSFTVNRDAFAAYKTYICIGGFVVGRSSQTELGTGEYPVVCYDLACPNCYHEDMIAKNMSLESGGRVSCSRCSRTYDLNNEGVVVSGSKGKKLERYRISYSSTTIMIAN